MDLPRPSEWKPGEATKSLMKDLEEIAYRVNEIRPLTGPVLKTVQRQLLGERVFSSNAIEGNTLTLRETLLTKSVNSRRGWTGRSTSMSSRTRLSLFERLSLRTTGSSDAVSMCRGRRVSFMMSMSPRCKWPRSLSKKYCQPGERESSETLLAALYSRSRIEIHRPRACLFLGVLNWPILPASACSSSPVPSSTGSAGFKVFMPTPAATCRPCSFPS